MGDIELTEKEALVEGEVPAAAAAGDADVVAATQLKLVITLDADMAEWRVVNKNMGLSREQGCAPRRAPGLRFQRLLLLPLCCCGATLLAELFSAARLCCCCC